MLFSPHEPFVITLYLSSHNILYRWWGGVVRPRSCQHSWFMMVVKRSELFLQNIMDLTGAHTATCLCGLSEFEKAVTSRPVIQSLEWEPPHATRWPSAGGELCALYLRMTLVAEDRCGLLGSTPIQQPRRFSVSPAIILGSTTALPWRSSSFYFLYSARSRHKSF